MQTLASLWRDRLTPELDQGLAETLGTMDLGAAVQAVDSTFRSDLAAMLDGLDAYRSHPYARPSHEAPIVWKEGTTVLRRFGDEQNNAPGRSVLVVPSLVNRASILDLDPDFSFCQSLAREGGHNVYLIDWSEPGSQESGFGLSDYVERLTRAIDAIPDVKPAGGSSATPERNRKKVSTGSLRGQITAIGYCMGGLLALPAALKRVDRIDRLAFLAVPWDFHAEPFPIPDAIRVLNQTLDPLLTAFGHLPVDLIQALFASLDPLSAFRKFKRFSKTPSDSSDAKRFVALEDWLNDGVPLSAAVARETLGGWYAENKPYALQWRLDGRVVDPADFKGEALTVIPTSDRIVPPKSALAMTERLVDTRLIRPPLGHIGMMTSDRAEDLWSRISRFAG